LLIPATLSWVFGAIGIVGTPIGIYQNFEIFQRDTHRLVYIATIVMPVASLISGSLNILAGIRWFKGRWVWALICNGLAYGAMVFASIFEEIAFDASRRM